MTSELKYEDRLKEFEGVLNEYQRTIGLDKIIYNDEVEKVLQLREDQLKNLDKDGCLEYAFLLAQYSATILTEYNRNQVRLTWARSELNKLVAKYHNKYADKYMKYEIIQATIINNDGAAQVLDRIITHAQARVLQLDSISDRVDMMSRILNGKRYGQT